MKYLKLVILSSCLLLLSCGDFPDYRYEQSEEYCVLTFPFAAGFLDRKYIGYFNLTSTLQYLDSDPEVEIFIGEPSHIEMEPGSVQKVEIDEQFYIPQFHKNYLQAELQYWGPAFTFDKQQSDKIYAALKQGHNLTVHGRVEVGQQYETELYNFFFDDVNTQQMNCVNRLLSEEDVQRINAAKQ